MYRNTVLAVYAVVQFLGVMTFASTSCLHTVLKTPAVYFEYAAQLTDKPIYPIVLAIQMPSATEFNCALKSELKRDALVFLVSEKELADLYSLVEQNPPTSEPGEVMFDCILVKRHSVTQLAFRRAAAVKTFNDLSAYFANRNPQLHDRLLTVVKRLGG